MNIISGTVVKEFPSADLKLMSEIEEKVKSGDKTDIIESLNLFEANWNKLPYRRAREFIQSLKENKDIEIKTKAENIYASTIKSGEDKIIENAKEYAKSLSFSLPPIQNQMMYLSKAFDASKNMAELAKSIQSLTKTQYTINNVADSLNQLIKNQEIIHNVAMNIPNFNVTKPTFNIEYSPILRTDLFFSQMPKTIPEQTESFGNILNKNDREINENLKIISDENKEFAFNGVAYELLFTLENYFRGLILKFIINENRTNLGNYIPQKILDGWVERKQIEDANEFAEGEYDLIYYSNFTDIKDILRKNTKTLLNLKLFNDEQLATITSKLHELDPIRKKIAHNRALSKKEFDRLQMYCDDMLPQKE